MANKTSVIGLGRFLDIGEKRACLILEKVDHLLTTLGTDEALKTKRTKNGATVYPLQNHRNEGLLRSVVS
jgi:hypothetical protein